MSNLWQVSITVFNNIIVLKFVFSFIHYYKSQMKFQYFREFSALTSGKRHYRNLHMETIPFKCICCDQMVKNDAAYVLHLKKIHDVTKKQIDAARKIEMDGKDFLLVISEKIVVIFKKITT